MAYKIWWKDGCVDTVSNNTYRKIKEHTALAKDISYSKRIRDRFNMDKGKSYE